jgi:hypothetical protein
MLHDPLTRTLYDELCRIPLLDPHSHIDPFAPTARSLDDLLGYHYYTELAHAAGMGRDPLRPDVDPRERCRAILAHMDRFDNTAQYSWFVEIVHSFLGLEVEHVTAADADHLFDTAKSVFSRPDWESEVFRRSNLEKIFLTNNFDDRLDGFDATKYVPCLRTDDLVFHLDKPEVRQRLAKTTGAEVGDAATLRKAVGALFERFDAVLAPSTQVFPFAVTTPWPEVVDGRRMDTYHRWMETVMPWSMAGTPVLGMPAGFDTRGLPTGVQLVGPVGADRAVLRLGRAYEEATQWVAKYPPVIVS